MPIFFFSKEDLNLILFSLIPFPFFILNQLCILFKLRMKSLLSQGLNLLHLIKVTHFLNHKHDPRKSLVSTSWYATSAVISSGTSTPLLPPDYLCGSLHCWKTRSWEENQVFLVGKPEIQSCWFPSSCRRWKPKAGRLNYFIWRSLQSRFSAGVDLVFWIQGV